MNRNHETVLGDAHQPLDRHSTPKKSLLNRRLQSVSRERRNMQLSQQTPEELEQDRWEGIGEGALREQNILSAHQVKAIWQQQVGKARMVSGQLAEEELLKSQSHIDRLAGLVQERYAISRAEADIQVAAFLRRRHS